RLGLSVVLLEKSTFPRHKICGDFLSPGTVSMLESLGLARQALERSGAAPVCLSGMRITLEGTQIRSGYPEGRPGWGLSRRDLDALLARRAEAAGARLVESLQVRSFSRAGPDAWRVEGTHPDGTRRAWIARLLVEAGGRHGPIARRLGWNGADPRLVRFALWSHMEGVRGLSGMGEMHLFEGGYVGVAALDESGLANVTMVIDAPHMRRARGDVRAYFLSVLASHLELGRRLQSARFAAPLRGLGPLALRARRVAGDGIALVGDAGGFVDPFTGEGVNVALASAQMLAQAVAANGPGRPAAEAEYARAWRRGFNRKFVLCRALQSVLSRPFLARRVARALASRRDLAERLVAATGDLAPPASVMGPSYLTSLLLAAATSARA
ncbi:MAG TPA: NAD(P)/FAD-dependent oxidoreductase, partial [Candidatus Polarisedimenticolia bacterium]|nr:NAD(P)/FAD-dependent oxidoreductase [Candidatus Polarisedimenticolia bacterium]